MKMSSTYKFIFIQIKLIFHWKGFAGRLVLKQRHKVTTVEAIVTSLSGNQLHLNLVPVSNLLLKVRPGV